jgi:SAM-dependent methyltransferase
MKTKNNIKNKDLSEFFIKKQKKWKNRYFGKYNFKKKLSPYIKDSILDYGCGFGNLANIIAKDYPKKVVTGIDIDKEKIKYAKRSFIQKNLTLSYNLTLKKDFDTIILFNVLHEIGEKTLSYLIDHLNFYILIYDFRKVSKEDFMPWFNKKKIIHEYKRSFQEEYNIHNRWDITSFKDYISSLSIKPLLIEKAGDYWFWFAGKKIIKP